MVDKFELVEAIKAHALQNYEKDGWDYVVETWDDGDIEAAIGNCATLEAAIYAVQRKVKVLADYRSDIQGTAF